MKCPNCGSTNYGKSGLLEDGSQRYKCKSCNRKFTEKTASKTMVKTITEAEEQNVKIGMSIVQFREKHDVDYILEKILNKLKRDTIYEKNDIIKLSGLRAGYPGLSASLEAASDYKGKAGGINYWGHPETINDLKKQRLLS